MGEFYQAPGILTVALRGSDRGRFLAAFCFAASVTTMLFTTCFAPEVLAMRVAAPLCWTTSARPLRYAVPFDTLTVNFPPPAFDLANLVCMACSSAASPTARPLAAAAGGFVSVVFVWLQAVDIAQNVRRRSGRTLMQN